MQEEQTVVDIDVADGRARLAISRHVGQFIIRTESLAVGRSPDTAGDVILLAHDIVPNPVDGMDVSRIAREGCHIGHPGIHVSGPHGMPYGFVLLHHGLVRLAVSVAPRSMAALVKEELRLVQVLAVARHDIEFGQGHFGYLMAGHTYQLPLLRTDFTAHAVGITDGYVKEITFARGLVMSDGTFHHVAEVIKLVAQVLYFFPTLAARPFVRMLGIHRAARVQIAVRLLRCRHNGQHAVDIRHQFLVRISLQQIACAFYRFIYIRIIKRIPSDLVTFARMGSFDKVFIPAGLFTFTEGQRDGNLTARLQALPPKGIRHLDGRERYGRKRITVAHVLRLHVPCHGEHTNGSQQSFLHGELR